MDGTRPPGRPRDPGVDTSILAAARELVMETGYGSATIEAVARRAGVGRPTIYRRWTNKADLLFDALFEATETRPVPNSGDLVTDLVFMAKVLANDLSSPAAAQALVAVMAEVGSDSEIAAQVREQAIRPRVAELAVVVERAQQQGSARQNVDPTLVIHAIAGVLYYHAAVLGEATTDELVNDVVSLLVGGLAATPATSAST